MYLCKYKCESIYKLYFYNIYIIFIYIYRIRLKRSGSDNSIIEIYFWVQLPINFLALPFDKR